MSDPSLQIISKQTGEPIDSLRNSIKITPERGTDFINITAYHTDRATAVHIANATADAYIERRVNMENERAKKALETLDDELKKQSDIVQDRRKEFAALIQEYGIPYSDDRGELPLKMTEEKIFFHTRGRLDKLEDDGAQLEIQINWLSSIFQNDSMRPLTGLELPPAQMNFYYTQYREARDSASTLQAQGLGPNHPEIQALNSKARNDLSNAKKEVVSLKEVLTTRLKLVNSQVERMRKMVAVKQGNTINFSMHLHSYNQAQTEYEAARDMLGQMKTKQQEARVLLNMPRIPITLHERAK